MYLSKRNAIYYLWFVDESGRQRKVTTRTSNKGEALKFVQNFKRESHDRRSGRIPISQFSIEFVTYLESTHSKGTSKLYRHAIGVFKRICGDVLLILINPRHFDTYKATRVHEVSPVSVNIELRALRTALNVAVRWQMIEKNPFNGLKLLRVPEEAPAYFSKEDFRAVLERVKEPWFKDVLIFTVLTGLRRGELVNLQWPEVNLERRTIAVISKDGFTTKAGKKRNVPLNETAYQMLCGRKTESKSDYVFSRGTGRLCGYWLTHKLKKITTALKMDPNLNFHALRHTFASWLVQDGVSIYEVQKLLGHADVTTTQIYSHLQPEDLHHTVDRLKINLN